MNKYAKFEVVSAFKLETFKYCKFSNLLKILSESKVLEISKFVKSIEVNLSKLIRINETGITIIEYIFH